jgi:RNA polymerase sigma-70 factor (ECF subfamily)
MDQFGGLVWSLARRYTDSATDAEDATQEIFLEIWRSAARYDSGAGSEAVFIATIARRRLIDRLRASGRRPATEEFDETTHHEQDDGSGDRVVFAAEADAARAALAELDEGQREVLLLGIVEGMTHSEIALHTGRPLGTVKTQMRRGLHRVRAMLSDAEGQADD